MLCALMSLLLYGAILIKDRPHYLTRVFPSYFQVKARLQKMGALTPLNIFLRQEIDRMQRVITVVRHTLTDLQLAIEGTIIMSEVRRIIKEHNFRNFPLLQDCRYKILLLYQNLRDALDNIYDARVPRLWQKVKHYFLVKTRVWTIKIFHFVPASLNQNTRDVEWLTCFEPSIFLKISIVQISWESSTIGFWYTELIERNQQFFTWVFNGRPKVFWMTGFFNPQGFLTAMRQEVTRAHKGWALDSVVLHNEVTKQMKEDITSAPSVSRMFNGFFFRCEDKSHFSVWNCDWPV